MSVGITFTMWSDVIVVMVYLFLALTILFRVSLSLGNWLTPLTNIGSGFGHMTRFVVVSWSVSSKVRNRFCTRTVNWILLALFYFLLLLAELANLVFFLFFLDVLSSCHGLVVFIVFSSIDLWLSLLFLVSLGDSVR